MRLVNSDVFINIDLDIEKINVIVCESPEIFSKLVVDLCDGLVSDDRSFVLSHNNNELIFSKIADVVLNPITLNINDKKIITRLHSKLLENTGDFNEQKEKINSYIIKLLDDIVNTVTFSNIEYNIELDWANLLKMYSVRFEESYDNLPDRIIEYVKVSALLLGTKVLFFVNLKSYLSKDELLAVHEIAMYLDIYIVLIENCELNNTGLEHNCIIDADLCVINI